MKSRKIQENPATYVVIFDKEDEVSAGLKHFAGEENLSASSFTAIGAFRDVVLGYFDRLRMDYRRLPVHAQVEVLSLVGDISLKDGEPEVHAHVVVGKQDGSTAGGHLLEAHVWPTLEVVVTESPAHLRRRKDEETGLALIDLDEQEEGLSQSSHWKNYQVITEKRRI